VIHDWFIRKDLAEGDRLQLAGPNPTTMLDVTVKDLSGDADAREVLFTPSGRSTDTRLVFECGKAENTANSVFGRKLREKLLKQQAGAPIDGTLRLFILNFAESDTGWPDFIAWPEIASRIEETIPLLVGSSVPPYDAVLPAWLDLDACFGLPVWLDQAKRNDLESFIRAAGLDRICSPEVQDQRSEIDELL
jgi:hypothetical protein